jgi:sigma-B regulation protein RsbU (phosphoserine phosphatase)
MPDPALNINPEHFASLLKIGLRLTAERDLDRLLRTIMEETTAVMDADRSSLYLIDTERGEMWAKISQGTGVIDIRFPVGVGVAGAVGTTGEVINIADAYNDGRFNPEFDRKTGYRTKSILCAPLRNTRGEIIGAIQVLNKRTGSFGSEDETLLTALSSHAAVAIENADLYRRLSVLNLSLERKVEERTAELTAANERLSALNRELEEISITDGLTKAYNRRYFTDRLRQEIKRVSRYGPTVSLLMIDIDHFKKVNDTWGHLAGDAVLTGVAGVIKSRLRGTDLFARYGGEEFCLLATGTDLAGAQVLAERVRELVQNTEFRHGGNTIAVTVSIGVSAWESSLGQDMEELIRRADGLLYRAKEQGRNRVCV